MIRVPEPEEQNHADHGNNQDHQQNNNELQRTFSVMTARAACSASAGARSGGDKHGLLTGSAAAFDVFRVPCLCFLCQRFCPAGIARAGIPVRTVSARIMCRGCPARILTVTRAVPARPVFFHMAAFGETCRSGTPGCPEAARGILFGRLLFPPALPDVRTAVLTGTLPRICRLRTEHFSGPAKVLTAQAKVITVRTVILKSGVCPSGRGARGGISAARAARILLLIFSGLFPQYF